MSPGSIREHYETVETLAHVNYYKQIPMLCCQGLHEFIEQIALKYLSPGQRILDVGCGRGAFALRMHDGGFSVDACDLFDLCMCKDEVNFMCVSAEASEFGEALYDAVFILELIEHTESPFAVIRKYAELVKPGGYLVISTPNVDSDISRAWFLLCGRHWYFEAHNVTTDGHIMPIHDFQLKYLFAQLQLKLVETVNLPEGRRIRVGVLWGVLQLLRIYHVLKGVPPNAGEATVYVVQRPA